MTISKNYETKKERFTRLAERRVNVILEQFRKLGNLSNARNYEYTEDEVKRIFLEINRALRRTKNLFSENQNREKRVFKLRG
jgi:uncharacterized Fe-S cluster-containing protein